MQSHPLLKFILPILVLMLPEILFAAVEPRRIESQAFGFGSAVQTDGDIVVAGAPVAVIDGNVRQGEVFIFEWRDSRWVETGRIRAMDGGAEHRFGTAVAVDEDVVLVGAPNAPVEGLLEAGAVYVFMRDGSGEWVQADKLTADDPTTMAHFGAHIGIDGTRAIIGAPGADEELGESSGAAYVFDNAGSGWQQAVKLKEEVTPRFARSVDVSGNRVVVAGGNEGSVFVYAFAAGSWDMTSTLQPVVSGARTVFVKLEDDVLVVAAPGEDIPDVPLFMGGVVHVFEYDGGDWREIVALDSPEERNQEYFGLHTDLNDGLLATANGFEYEDHVYLYMFDENSEWALVHELEGPLHIEQSLAVSASALVIGSPDQMDGYNGFIEIYRMEDLLPDEPSEDDDPATGDDDTGDDPGGDDGDDDTGSGGDDEQPVTGDDDEDDETGGDEGDDDNGDEGDEGDDGDETGGDDDPEEEDPPQTGGGGGGGALGWLLALLIFSVLRCRVVRGAPLC